MQPRTSLSTQFSSFARIEQDRFQAWLLDPRLHRRMQHQLQLQDVASPSFWALYWYRAWCLAEAQSLQADSTSAQSARPQAEGHLAAYLQEACYWTAVTIRKKTARLDSTSLYSLSDYFQMASAYLRPVLQKFDDTAFNNLNTFAQGFLTRALMTDLRREKVASFYSIWGLLYKTSNRLALKVMGDRGLSHAQTEQYRLLWMAFKAVYEQRKGDKAKLEDPQAEIWDQIVEFYNRKRLGQLSQPGPKLSSEQASQMLRQLAQWIRDDERPGVQSLDYKPDEAPAQELPSTAPLPMEQLVGQEEADARAAMQAEVRRVLSNAFGQLDPESQTILQLLYQAQMSQAEIVEQLGKSQPTISRRLRGARDQLTRALVDALSKMTENGSESSVNKPLDPRRLKDIDRSLKAFFAVHLPADHEPNPDA